MIVFILNGILLNGFTNVNDVDVKWHSSLKVPINETKPGRCAQLLVLVTLQQPQQKGSSYPCRWVNWVHAASSGHLHLINAGSFRLQKVKPVKLVHRTGKTRNPSNSTQLSGSKVSKPVFLLLLYFELHVPTFCSVVKRGNENIMPCNLITWIRPKLRLPKGRFWRMFHLRVFIFGSDTFTDTAISSSRVNGEHKEKVLQRWEGGDSNGENYDLDNDAVSLSVCLTHMLQWINISFKS